MNSFRLVHVGVAAAMAAATVTAIGLVQAAGAASTAAASVFVPITPCRLIDTRPAPDNVGTRTTPIGSGDTATFQVTGTNGNCVIPATATGIATNATVVNPSASSYITIFPADASPRPTASNLNFVARAAPTPNQVTVGLSATGAISAYNLSGTVDLLLDIVGYYEAGSGGAQGPQGIPGIQGPPGKDGKDGVPSPTCPTDGCTVDIQGVNAFGSLGYLTGGCVYGSAARLPLDLPLGAIISKVNMRYVDGDPSNQSSFTLLRITFPANTSDPASNGNTSLDGTHTVDLTLNSAASTAVSTTVSYLVLVTNNGSNVFDLCGATVTYHF
ncbi:MAG: hypothetical protein JWL72_1496 [Ilumatobacteraceae bacterium]|nr:hypothetical protein [Ilumatobacteraceae bacterium]MCU1388158.1 hypothetical protein [Ilumatobacteraceae bacterium]